MTPLLTLFGDENGQISWKVPEGVNLPMPIMAIAAAMLNGMIHQNLFPGQRVQAAAPSIADMLRAGKLEKFNGK